jgi:hypothetical protein
MKTIEINLYKFDELCEESQQTAIRSYQTQADYYDWWDDIYRNAKEVGVSIDSFDVSRNYISVSFMLVAHDVANALIYFWGADSDIGEVSQTFLDNRNVLYKKYAGDEASTYNEKLYNAEDELVDDFHSNVSDYFRNQLRSELEWIESEEYIRGFLYDMDYDFTEDGKQY